MADTRGKFFKSVSHQMSYLASPMTRRQRPAASAPALPPGTGVAAVRRVHLVELAAPGPHEQLAAVSGGEHAPDGGVKRDARAPRPRKAFLTAAGHRAVDPGAREGLVLFGIDQEKCVWGEGEGSEGGTGVSWCLR